MRVRLTLIWVVTTVGCLDGTGALDPKVEEAINERCVDADSDPDQDVSYTTDILPMFMGALGPVGCSCHIPSEPDPIGFEQTGLDLSRYDGLIEGGANSTGGVIVPGKPCASIIVQKTSPGPPFGSRMPLSGPPFLDAAARQRLADWIAEGAINDTGGGL